MSASLISSSGSHLMSVLLPHKKILAVSECMMISSMCCDSILKDSLSSVAQHKMAALALWKQLADSVANLSIPAVSHNSSCKYNRSFLYLYLTVINDHTYIIYVKFQGVVSVGEINTNTRNINYWFLIFGALSISFATLVSTL